MNNKKKDFIQVILLIVLLFLYAYSETKRKKDQMNNLYPELVTPSPGGPDIKPFTTPYSGISHFNPN